MTRWIVARMTPIRTTSRRSSSSDERLRPEAVEPRPERGVRVERDLRLHADEVLDRRDGAVASSGSSSSCRASVARLSARRLSTSSIAPILATRRTRPERGNSAERVDKWGIVV